MWRFVCVLLLASCCFADDLDMKEHWGKFKSAFKKKFQSKHQESEKRTHFEKTVKAILKHNLAADLGEHTYKKGINEFTDMPHAEFAETYLGLKLPKNATRNYPPPSMKSKRQSAPENFDWRNLGVVTSVKHQGKCGSCWAFASTAATESAHAIRSGRLVDFSEQQLVDCSGEYGTSGCHGSSIFDAYMYIEDYGIETENCYPYQKQQSTCSYNSDCVQTKISKYYDVPEDEDTMKEYLFLYGPLSVSIHVNDNMQEYSQGIFSDDGCDESTSHAVLLVGYGTENGQDYWTIKNSWGDWWGENGYMRMARNVNMCRITTRVAFPSI